MFPFFATALAVQIACWLALALGLRGARQATGEATRRPAAGIRRRGGAGRSGAAARSARGLAAQTHPAFEVVIVDDASEDTTAALVEPEAAADPRFRLVRVDDAERPASMPRKKHALTLGIAAARHDRLAFTDADCVPPPRWLDTLAAHAAAAPDAVLVGYGPYRRERGGLNAFVRYETLVTALLTAAAVGLGRPYMAVGRNFSYPKSVFDRIGGFAHSAQSLSGDDDLLVQEAHRHGVPVRYVFDPEAFVLSEAPATWQRWARQKLRHTSAGRFYDRVATLALALFHGSALAVWLAPVFLGWTGAGLLAARFLVQRAVLRDAMEMFGEHDLTLAQPLLDAGYALYTTVLAPLGAVFTPKQW